MGADLHTGQAETELVTEAIERSAGVTSGLMTGGALLKPSCVINPLLPQTLYLR